MGCAMLAICSACAFAYWARACACAALPRADAPGSKPRGSDALPIRGHGALPADAAALGRGLRGAVPDSALRGCGVTPSAFRRILSKARPLRKGSVRDLCVCERCRAKQRFNTPWLRLFIDAGVRPRCQPALCDRLGRAGQSVRAPGAPDDRDARKRGSARVSHRRGWCGHHR
jgi:hypothetical protein